MEEIHTHTFIGGPKDGQREAMQGADIERGSVTVRSVAPVKLEERGGQIKPTDTTYERTAFQGEKVRFIYWKAQGLSIDEATGMLFAHYINR